MNKNNSIIFGLFFLLMFVTVFAPFNLIAQEGGETAESTDQPVEDGVLSKLNEIIMLPLVSVPFLVGFSVLILLKFFPLILVISGIKIWILKKKLGINWKLKPMEKLAITTISKTTVEFTVFFLLLTLFFPAVYSILKNTFFMTGSGEWGIYLKLFVTAVFVIPYHCILSGMLGMLLIKLNTSEDIKSLRKYMKFSALIALITPVIIFVLIFILRFVLKLV